MMSKIGAALFWSSLPSAAFGFLAATFVGYGFGGGLEEGWEVGLGVGLVLTGLLTRELMREENTEDGEG